MPSKSGLSVAKYFYWSYSPSLCAWLRTVYLHLTAVLISGSTVADFAVTRASI